MASTQKERLTQFIDHLGISIYQFEKSIGSSSGVIAHSKDRISNNLLDKVIKVYPLLNPMWILTGEGEMLRSAGVNIDVDMSSGKHVQSPHTEYIGDSSAAAAMQAKIEALEAQVKSLEADKVKLMNLLDKCIGK